MSTGRKIQLRDGIFFITFTCYKWMTLFEIANCHNVVYDRFNYLISKGHQITGYVIMPNHVHALIALKQSDSTINTLVSNGKRFMAYEVVKQLKLVDKTDVLEKLRDGVTKRESLKGQIHRVFEHGFDVKVCESDWFIEQKLDYMHMNPCSKKWSLVENPIEYGHSSMNFYENGVDNNKTKLTSYTALFEE